MSLVGPVVLIVVGIAAFALLAVIIVDAIQGHRMRRAAARRVDELMDFRRERKASGGRNV